HSPRISRALLRLTDEVLDPLRRTGERRVVEEIRGRIRERVLRRVEVVRAGRRVERVPDRDLVTDDEHRLLGPFDEQPEGTCVAPRGVVETLASRERLRAPVRPLPAPV